MNVNMNQVQVQGQVQPQQSKLIKRIENFNTEASVKQGETKNQFLNLIKALTNQTQGTVNEQVEITCSSEIECGEVVKVLGENNSNLIFDGVEKEVIQFDTDEIKEELVNLDGIVDNRIFTNYQVRTPEKIIEDVSKEVIKQIKTFNTEAVNKGINKEQTNIIAKEIVKNNFKEKIEVIQNDTKLKVVEEVVKEPQNKVLVENNVSKELGIKEVVIKQLNNEQVVTELEPDEKENDIKESKIELKDLINNENKIIKISDESSEIKSSVVNQVREKIEVTVEKTDKGFEGVKEVKMKLNPESLGELDIKMEFKDGKIKVEIMTQSEETKKLLESSSIELTKILGKSEGKVVTVTVSSTNKNTGEQGNKDNSEGKRQQENPEQHKQHQNKNEQDEVEAFYEMISMKNKMLFKI